MVSLFDRMIEAPGTLCSARSRVRFRPVIPFRRVKNRLPTHKPVALAHDCGMSAGQQGL